MRVCPLRLSRTVYVFVHQTATLSQYIGVCCRGPSQCAGWQQLMWSQPLAGSVDSEWAIISSRVLLPNWPDLSASGSSATSLGWISKGPYAFWCAAWDFSSCNLQVCITIGRAGSWKGLRVAFPQSSSAVKFIDGSARFFCPISPELV